MLAVNRRDVDELNALARTKLLEGGMLGDEVLRTEERSFALSDEVVCLRNAKKLGVLNGTRGTVVGFDADGLNIETSAGPRVLPRGTDRMADDVDVLRLAVQRKGPGPY